MSSFTAWLIIIAISAIPLAVYLAPVWIARRRQHESKWTIASLTIGAAIACGIAALAGFALPGTFLLIAGWLAALIWACSGTPSTAPDPTSTPAR